MKMTIIFFLILLLQLTLLLADDAITRGPDIGEIYFIGPTVSGEGIFRSTDFGETAICMDSSYYYNQILSICADLTPGSVYMRNQSPSLYYSNNYGQQNSWIFRSYPISEINSGRNEGVIYNKCSSHSNDYGANFIQHQINGFFGSRKTFEIDNEDNVGYAITTDIEPYSIYFLISYDNFENLEIQHVFNMVHSKKMLLTRGFDNGELFLFYDDMHWDELDKHLIYSNDYGNSWELKNTFNCPNLPIKGIVGGRQPGELYMVVEYTQSMYLICHTFIYHSLDYGETFTIYHPISIGPDPYYADFEAAPTSGSAPLTVQFTDLSGGDPNWITGWEWDFDDDGIIDSYEQHPEYTYQDTGYYSVMLYIMTGGGTGEEVYAYRENYIHVTDGSNVDNYELTVSNYMLRNYPNPFNPETTIYFETTDLHELAQIEIFNVKGQKIKEFNVILSGDAGGRNKGSVIWDGTDSRGNSVSSGIYLYKLDLSNSPIKKMILLK